MHRGEEQCCLKRLFSSLLTPNVLQRSRIQVWLYEQVNMRIEGCIIVSTSMSPCYCWLSHVHRSDCYQEKVVQGKKNIHTSLMISLNV